MAKVSKAQLTECENRYGKIKEIVIGREVEIVEDPKTKKQKEIVIDQGKVGYLRKPDRATIKYAMTKTVRADQTIDTISSGEVVLKKCWLGGDDEINTDDRYYFRACMEANNYLNKITGFL
ncbi:MAG: hypothetical protein GY751_04975 [Bacteroidetes bacterium]|nr:hypothetical protein [Bacteroidota bacterium]